MLNKSIFRASLGSAQWKIAQSGSISPEKIDVYWEEFKDATLTDEQFSDCVAAVSRRSNFFPKVPEIWEEVIKAGSKCQFPVFEPFDGAIRIPKPSWFDEMYALCRDEQKNKQDSLNGGKYIGSSQF